MTKQTLPEVPLRADPTLPWQRILLLLLSLGLILAATHGAG